MKVLCIRTAMCGGGLSYDVYVPFSEINPKVLDHGTTIIPCGYSFKFKDGRYVDGFKRFEDATISPEHMDMPLGLERYEDVLQHDKKAQSIALSILQSVFPETKVLDKYPTLWVNNLPVDKETSAKVWTEYHNN